MISTTVNKSFSQSERMQKKGAGTLKESVRRNDEICVSTGLNVSVIMSLKGF